MCVVCSSGRFLEHTVLEQQYSEAQASAAALANLAILRLAAAAQVSASDPNKDGFLQAAATAQQEAYAAATVVATLAAAKERGGRCTECASLDGCAAGQTVCTGKTAAQACARVLRGGALCTETAAVALLAFLAFLA